MAQTTRERSSAWAVRSVTCRSDCRTMPVVALRTAAPAFALIAFNSVSVKGMVRWLRSPSFSRSASSGAISATTFRWAWVSLTGNCRGVSAIGLHLVLFPWQALPQDVQQVDQELIRPLLLDQLGAGPDPRRILDQSWERADAGVDRVDQDALDGLW